MTPSSQPAVRGGFTGLGLNIVYNIVKDVMKGSISCESPPGKGTTFRIEYPYPDCSDELISVQ